MKNTTKDASSNLDSMNRHFLITGVIADKTRHGYRIIFLETIYEILNNNWPFSF